MYKITGVAHVAVAMPSVMANQDRAGHGMMPPASCRGRRHPAWRIVGHAGHEEETRTRPHWIDGSFCHNVRDEGLQTESR